MSTSFWKYGAAETPGRDREGYAVRRVGQAQRGAELRLQHAQHTHAVFKLGVLLEEFVRRELASGKDVELVPAEEDARAVLFKAPVAELGYHVQRLGGVLLCERRQRVQPLAELRQSHRDYRHAVHPGVQRLEVAHRAHKLLSVVEAGAANDLAVHRDAGFREAAHGVYRLSGARIAQHGAAQLRICRVDGDVYRAYMQRDDALLSRASRGS